MAIDIESMYRAYGPMVLRRCRRLLRDEGKAVDAMHDVFVELLRRKDTLHDGAPAALLLTTATHVCLNRLRGERRRPEDSDDALVLAIASADGPDQESRTLARRVLGRVFGGSPPSTQLMAVLHYVDGLTLDEVAAEVGLSVSGVRKRLRGVQQRLAGNEGASDVETAR